MFLGYTAGYDEINSNRLYIENSISSSPLIYGEFDNDILGLNADVAVGHQTPNATLDIVASNTASPANTDGLLIPRIDVFPSSNPGANQNGMMVFLTSDNSFYYWNQSSTSWVKITNTSDSIERIDDLVDGKSDNDGTDDGSSIFLGVNAGANDDGTNNHNVSVGPNTLRDNISGSNNSALGNEALIFNTTGYQNTALGQKAMNFNISGFNNTAIGNKALRNSTNNSNNTVIGISAGENLTGDNNVVLGYYSGYDSSGSNNVFLGRLSGYSESNSNRLYIENSSSNNPLIYGEFDTDFLRVNGNFEVERATNASATVVSPFGFESSLKLFERGGSGDFGFEFQYDGGPDKLFLWSRTFAGNEGIRMTWLKDGKVGLNDTSPDARLDIEAIDRNAPLNTDGVLVPRINNFPSANPGIFQEGMLVYLTFDDSFYYWDHSNTNWQKLSTVERIDDLIDARSDNDGSNNGSSIYFGIGAGQNDDQTNNLNVGIGYQAMNATNSGTANVAIGADAMNSNITGGNNVAIGVNSLENNISGGTNIAIGRDAMITNSSGNLKKALCTMQIR